MFLIPYMTLMFLPLYSCFGVILLMLYTTFVAFSVALLVRSDGFSWICAYFDTSSLAREKSVLTYQYSGMQSSQTARERRRMKQTGTSFIESY